MCPTKHSCLTALVVLLVILPSVTLAKDQKPTAPEKNATLEQLVAKVSPTYRKKIQGILDHHSISCKVKNTIDVPKFLYEYLLDRLDFTAKVLQITEMARYEIAKTGKEMWKIDDREGATAKTRLIYRNSHQRIYLAHGAFVTSMLPTIRGTGVIHLTYHPVKKDLLRCTATFYFRFSSQVLHRVTQALEKVLQKIVQYKSKKIVKSAQAVGELIHKRPKKVYKKIAASSQFTRRERREFKLLFVRRK